MRAIRLSLATLAVLAVGFVNAQAADVTVKGAHLCCPACVNAVKEALGDVKGVSDAAADQKEKTITFKAADDKAATDGINALAKAGFHGTATADGKELKYPAPDIKKGEKANTVVATG